MGRIHFDKRIGKAGFIMEYFDGQVRVFASIDEAPTGDGVFKYRNYGYIGSNDINGDEDLFESGKLELSLDEPGALLSAYEIINGMPIPIHP